MRKKLIYIHNQRRYDDLPLNFRGGIFVASAQHCVSDYTTPLPTVEV